MQNVEKFLRQVTHVLTRKGRRILRLEREIAENREKAQIAAILKNSDTALRDRYTSKVDKAVTELRDIEDRK